MSREQGAGSREEGREATGPIPARAADPCSLLPATYTTILDDFDVAMRLGIHPHEAVPQRVRLSVRMTVAYERAPSADRIEEVLDYDFVREGVLAMAAGEGFALQETLVEAVAALCLSDARVREVRVRSMKLDVYPDARVGCEVVRGR